MERLLNSESTVEYLDSSLRRQIKELRLLEKRAQALCKLEQMARIDITSHVSQRVLGNGELNLGCDEYVQAHFCRLLVGKSDCRLQFHVNGDPGIYFTVPVSIDSIDSKVKLSVDQSLTLVREDEIAVSAQSGAALFPILQRMSLALCKITSEGVWVQTAEQFEPVCDRWRFLSLPTVLKLFSTRANHSFDYARPLRGVQFEYRARSFENTIYITLGYPGPTTNLLLAGVSRDGELPREAPCKKTYKALQAFDWLQSILAANTHGEVLYRVINQSTVSWRPLAERVLLLPDLTRLHRKVNLLLTLYHIVHVAPAHWPDGLSNLKTCFSDERFLQETFGCSTIEDAFGQLKELEETSREFVAIYGALMARRAEAQAQASPADERSASPFWPPPPASAAEAPPAASPPSPGP